MRPFQRLLRLHNDPGVPIHRIFSVEAPIKAKSPVLPKSFFGTIRLSINSPQTGNGFQVVCT